MRKTMNVFSPEVRERAVRMVLGHQGQHGSKGGGLVHHSDRGSQYLSIKYTERLAEAGIELIGNNQPLENLGLTQQRAVDPATATGVLLAA
ncbi:MAG: hypothetical protein VR70_06650 [Rhodospirillaceae bacterium BRH_c57]|nr:MAG: hypothetical protein VR70_06650 [Rhodospirillaceae bacterium BRH_c57]